MNGVSEKYREKVKKGTLLLADKEYLSKAFELTYIIIYGTILAVSEINKDNYNLHEVLHEFAFQHMVDGDWQVSNYVYKNIKNRKTKSTQIMDMEMRKINYWISLKNMYGVEKIREEVDEYDVSAMEGEFKIAKACLLDDYKEISNLLEKYLNERIYPQCIEQWPLFIQYRKSAEYKKFKKQHISEFTKQIYAAEEIQHNDISDEILQKSECIPE